MRKNFAFPALKKSYHPRRRYSHYVSGSQSTQENININTQGLQSTSPENIWDDYNDDMDFQYDYDNEESSKGKDEGMSTNEDNEESPKGEDEGMSTDEDERILEGESEESLEESSEYEESSEESSEYESEESLEDEDEIEDKSSEDEEEYGNVIDEAFDKNKMPPYNSDNEFAPYFENFTTASLFCWIQKHNISTCAYEDLVEIIHNPQFVSTHVIKNVRRFRKWRQHLPLLPISARSIPISSKKTPSTSKDSKMAYQLSINDIIWHVLNNPSLMKHMYFGPGIDSEIKSEYWHGTLWGESPFYGKEKITISKG